MILLRTQSIDESLVDFADQLARWSGLPVCYLVDERKGPVQGSLNSVKIGLTRKSCAALGLYCPPNFAWLCGDYGFYLARKQFPEVDRFWMIENDVRIAGTRPQAFFEAFANDQTDLIASYIEPAPETWHWFRTLVCRDRPVYKCFFPVTRVTAKSIDQMLEARRRHSQRISRRYFWANDEGFVATSVMGSGGSWKDFNTSERKFYETNEFSFENVIDETCLPAIKAEARLLHPVLCGDALAQKRHRMLERGKRPSRGKRIRMALSERIGPAAWMLAWNRCQTW